MRPIVHNITNYVTAADCANITLAIGASPIMADEQLEVYEVASIADGLVLNTGTISEKRFEAMLTAGNAARKKGIPIVLDPVGAGVSKFRTNVVKAIITQINPDIIRLNASELKSLCSGTRNTNGVDGAAEDGDDVITLARAFALKSGAVISVSGDKDIVTDGKSTAVVSGGHPLMRKITGAGCMLSSVTGAFVAANPASPLNAAVAASAVYGICGSLAYEDGIGAATYKCRFFDRMTNPILEGMEIEYR